MSYEPDWRSKSGELCEMYDEVKLLKAENEKLRAVAEAAKNDLKELGYFYTENDFVFGIFDRLRTALGALDE